MKTKKTFFRIFLICCIFISMMVPTNALSSTPVIEVVPDRITINQGAGTADVIYTISLDPNGNKVAAFQFTLTAPDGMTLATNKLPNGYTNQGGDGYWVSFKDLKLDENDETGEVTGIFESFAYNPDTGNLGASGGIEGRTLDEKTVIMTIKATINDVSKIETYTLGVANVLVGGVGSINLNADDAIVTGVTVVGHEHTYSTEWSKDDAYHWHDTACGHISETGDYAEHVYDQMVDRDEYKISDASCKVGAKYFKSCICGAKPADESSDNVFYTSTLADHIYGELITAVEEKHTQTEVEPAVAAHYFCDVCDTYFTEEKVATTLEALTGESHEVTSDMEIEDPHVHTSNGITGCEPTCNENGLTDGVICGECGEIIVAQKIIPSTGHIYSPFVIENHIDATAIKDGSYELVSDCTVCGEELARIKITIPATDGIENPNTADEDVSVNVFVLSVIIVGIAVVAVDTEKYFKI